jgi:DNA polymerase III subunit epsilon
MLSLSFDDKNLVVVDIETTGVNPFKHDALAIAFVPLNRSVPAKQVFISHQEIEWDEFARENFRKFESEWKRTAISPAQACSEIESYVQTFFGRQAVTLIGHNVGFDIAFLRKLAFQGGRDQIAGLSHRAVDTHTLLYLLAAEGKIPWEATKSDGAFQFFEIQFASNLRHTALEDARATGTLFIRVVQKLLERQVSVEH